MTYFERFRGSYDSEMDQIYQRRQALIDKARELQPENLDELLAASEEGELDHALDWVDVPNPWKPNDEDKIRVRPILGLGAGSEAAKSRKDRLDRGVWKLGIEARLPSGDSWYLGDVLFSSFSDGTPKYEPSLQINPSPTDSPYPTTRIEWDSADAELFLTLAEATLAAQPRNN